MKPMTSVIVMVALPMLVAGTTTAPGGGGSGAFPLAKCFTETHMKAYGEQLCTDLGQTDAYCMANREQIQKCKDQIMTGTNSQSIIQASVNCMQTVVGVTIPADKTTSADVYHKYILQLLDSNPDICAKVNDIVTCFKENSNITQLMQDCLTPPSR